MRADSFTEGLKSFSQYPLKKLKLIADEKRPITYGIVQCGPDFNGGVPYIRPVDMDEENRIKAERLLKTDPIIAQQYSRSSVKEGDLVISIGPSYGKLLVVPKWLEGANLTQGTARVAIRSEQDPKFFFWALRSSFSNQQWDSSVSGATFRALNLGPLAETLVPHPCKKKQNTIVHFLDRETSRIDRLIERKERFIELLKEKRQALITHAVTKGLPAEAAAKVGLDPKPPMKDSGIEWIGEVPAHWEIVPIRRFAKVQTGSTPSGVQESHFAENGFNWFTPGDFSEGIELHSASRALSDTGKTEVRIFPARSVLLVGIGATLGKVGISGQECSANQQINAIMCNEKAEPKFVAYALMRLKEVIFALGKFTTLPILNQDDTKCLVIGLPSQLEQKPICNYIEHESSRIARLISRTIRSIDLLRERRTALITAAVTGQINVSEPTEQTI